MKKTLCALVVLSSTSLPVLAASVDVAIIGTIKPAACKMELPAGETVDYGVIDPSILNGTDYTALVEKQLDITVSCDALVKMGLKTVNGRPGTLAGVTEGPTTAGLSPIDLFGAKADSVGLGLDGTDKIGGYAVRLATGTVRADGNPVDVIARADSQTAWAKHATGSLYYRLEPHYISWAQTGLLTPLAFRTMTGKIGVQAYINKKSELDLSKQIKLDGLTTIELVYI